ncbi:MAG: NAD(P)-binding protein [Actinomycetia bacterium]|nr:NAD(P)-binding protein [Actinomycetes bacterium]
MIGRENRKEYESFADACVRGGLPSCSVSCPLNLDVREIVRHVQEGNFCAAYKAYRVKAVFPEIVANLCDEPCRAGCVRRELDEGISLRLLEKACVEFARAKGIPSFNLPRKTPKIAVIGAGLSGLTCAVKLAAKNYPVTVYEKSARLGGRLWDLLDAEVFLPAIQAQLEATNCTVRLETEVTRLSDIEYEAVVVATGGGGEAFGLLEGVNPQSFGTKQPGAFIVGSLLGTTPVEDIAQGRIAASSVEKYLSVGAMDGMPETFRQTRCALTMDLSRVDRTVAVVPDGRGAYDEKAASAEAGRCLLCDCTVCSDGCELFDFVHRMPRRMVADAVASLHSRTNAGMTRAVSSCNLCGLCGKICPQGIDMGRFCRDFRVFKHEDGLLPPAFHDFFMSDMQFTMEEAYLARTAPGHAKAGYVFFPGCQLPAGDPRYVELTYHYLLQRIPDVGLILGCCGAPAEWGAETALRDGVAERLTAEWERFGRPEFVFACPTCKLQFERHMPEIRGVSLYTLLLDVGLPELETAREREACVFDPCSSRYDESMQRSVRRIAEKAGISVTELPYSGEKAQCCGWGGHIAAANPKLLNTIVRNRTLAHSLPYITYCANCQEIFTRRRKASRHILDIVLGLDRTEYPSPSLGQRRVNRLVAKRTVLEREWGVHVKDDGDDMHRRLGSVAIPEELLSRMYDDRILEEDVYRTIEYCEATSNAVYDPRRDLYIGHLRSGHLTYWVEYAKSAEGYVLSSVFSHRAQIVER